jgi:hypothetical protein
LSILDLAKPAHLVSFPYRPDLGLCSMVMLRLFSSASISFLLAVIAAIRQPPRRPYRVTRLAVGRVGLNAFEAPPVAVDLDPAGVAARIHIVLAVADLGMSRLVGLGEFAHHFGVGPVDWIHLTVGWVRRSLGKVL